MKKSKTTIEALINQAREQGMNIKATKRKDGGYIVRAIDGTKYTGKEFCKRARKYERYVANLGGNHTVAIVNGKVNDIWDSTDGCIGNYWTKSSI